MQYMLLIYLDENSLTEDQRDKCYMESAQYARELHASGHFVGAAPLYPTSTATSLRMRNDRRMVIDGPFAETREQLGGFFIVEAKDLDEAIDIASRVPAGKWGTVEIRPVMQIEDVPNNFSAGVDSAPARSM